MKSGFGLYAVGLLALAGVLGCGGETEVPANNKVVVPRIDLAEAPTELVVTPANAQVAMSWKAPAKDGGSRILGYTAWIYEEGKAARSQALKSTNTSAVITGLTNGASFSFAVAATNSLGDGQMSARSATVKPRVIPGAARDIQVEPGDRQVTVKWKAPEDTGMPIVGYTVEARLDNNESTLVASQTVTDTQVTFTGLTNGAQHRVFVTASNSVVPGPVALSPLFTPRTIPGTPRLETQVSSQKDRVTLNIFLDDTGGAPVSFNVDVYVNGTLTESNSGSLSTWEFAAGPGYTFRFVVSATNAAGAGPVVETTVQI